MRAIFHRLLAVLVALLFMGAFGSIIYFAEHYRSRSVEAGQAIIVECGQRFECPRECWLLIPIGILYVAALMAIFVSACFLLSKLFRDFSFRLWLLIILFGFFTTEASYIVSYHNHKDDYFCIGQTGIEQKYGELEWKAKYEEIVNVERKGSVFIVYLKNRRPVRVSDSRISQLYDSEKLIIRDSHLFYVDKCESSG